MKKILVAEDDIFLARAYKIKLEAEGFEAKIVGDGEEAMKVLEGFGPDLIILDLVMPKKDGFLVLEEIRRNKTYSNIPIIVVTNLSQSEDVDRANMLGATLYVVKSEIGVIELVDQVNKLLQ